MCRFSVGQSIYYYLLSWQMLNAQHQRLINPILILKYLPHLLSQHQQQLILFLIGSGMGGCTFCFRSLANVPVLFMNRTGKKSIIFPCWWCYFLLFLVYCICTFKNHSTLRAFLHPVELLATRNVLWINLRQKNGRTNFYGKPRKRKFWKHGKRYKELREIIDDHFSANDPFTDLEYPRIPSISQKYWKLSKMSQHLKANSKKNKEKHGIQFVWVRFIFSEEPAEV